MRKALIWERGGKTVKTHAGVQAEFARLVRDEPLFGIELRRFLGRAYNFKTLADYDVGPDANVTADQARATVAAAEQFVAVVAGLLRANGDSGAPDAQ